MKSQGMGSSKPKVSSGAGSATNRLASLPGANHQEPAERGSAAAGNAAGRAVVPASVFGSSGKENADERLPGLLTTPGVRLDGVGLNQGALSSKRSSRHSSLQSAASRMRRELSRCTKF